MEYTFVQEILETISAIENNKQPFEILSNSTSSITMNKETENIKAVTNLSPTIAQDLTSQSIYYKYLKVIVKKKNLWNTLWKNATPGAKVHLVRDDIFQKSPANLVNRNHQSVHTRLRIEHPNFTHVHLQKEELMKCDTCNTSISVEYILIDFRKYDKGRKKPQHSKQS